jgi:heme-degrading monooxygenase HmoA
MTALVATGKIKDPGFIKQMAKLMIEKMGPTVMKVFEGFKGVNLVMKEDGTFIYTSFWENREKIEALMESEMGKKMMALKADFFEEPIKIEYYEVIVQL